MNHIAESPEARYILPQHTSRTAGGERSSDPYSSLFQERIIFIAAPIDATTASDVMAQLLVLDAKDPDSEIFLYLNSPGGDFTSVAAIYDTMQFINADVHTVALGQASASAAILLAAGTSRVALPSAQVTLYQPELEGRRGQASDVFIMIEEAESKFEWFVEKLALHTGQQPEVIRRDIDRHKHLNAEQALAYGLIDNIVTKKPKTGKR